MTGLRVLKDSFLHFLFPHICSGCGSDLLSSESSLCLRCMDALPETNFEIHPGNPVEKNFGEDYQSKKLRLNITLLKNR